MHRLLLTLTAGAILGGVVGCRSTCTSCGSGGGSSHGKGHMHGVCDCDDGPQYGCHFDHAGHGYGSGHGGGAPATITMPPTMSTGTRTAPPASLATPTRMPAAPEALVIPPKADSAATSTDAPRPLQVQ